LKFLGLQFDGKVFSAATRKGSKLILTDRIKLLMEVFNELQLKTGFYTPDEAFDYIEEHFNIENSYETLKLSGT